jgi:hypothetical protein
MWSLVGVRASSPLQASGVQANRRPAGYLTRLEPSPAFPAG